jgi:hypothetical protein
MNTETFETEFSCAPITYNQAVFTVDIAPFKALQRNALTVSAMDLDNHACVLLSPFLCINFFSTACRWGWVSFPDRRVRRHRKVASVTFFWLEICSALWGILYGASVSWIGTRRRLWDRGEATLVGMVYSTTII